MIGVERITRALTLWRPWPWAILHAGKRVENRGWPPPRWVIGHRIARYECCGGMCALKFREPTRRDKEDD